MKKSSTLALFAALICVISHKNLAMNSGRAIDLDDFKRHLKINHLNRSNSQAEEEKERLFKKEQIKAFLQKRYPLPQPTLQKVPSLSDLPRCGGW